MNPLPTPTPAQLASYPVLVGAVIAVTELIKRYVPQVTGGVTILVSAILGGLAGLFHVEGLDPATGILIGLLAAGVHQTATAAGGK